ncbi:MAG: hypothetical protein QF524_05700, partial [Planctomycetota bacterium]|nr:hypothetical protein [Planctomycetota bacterium]
DYGSIPLFARTVPIDKQAWAQQVVNQFYILQNEYGLMPEYAEIGNEPDRLEFWEGTLKDYFDLYSLASTSLRAHFPAMKVGGMGLAGYESQLEADQPALLEMIEYTQTNELPLDFLSWHNYGMGLQMRYTGALSEQHAKLEEYGLDESVELFVSEWNIMPNASQDGEDFDGSHAAANLATFLTAGVEGGLDGSAFFMLYDIDDQEGIADLTGKGLGALTARGIKKPVYRIMEFLYGMSVEERIPVSGRESDLALTVMATRLGDRVRVLIANDIVDTQWHFVKSCKEEGLIQGQVFRVLQSLGASLFNHPSREQLMSTGLNEKEATSVLDVLHLVSEEARRSISTRLLTLDLGEATPTVTNVWRFDDSHNAPATHRNDLLPFLESVELSAGNQAKDAALNRLIALGYTDITLEQLVWQGDLASTSLALGIPEAAVASAADAGFSVMRTARLDQLDYLNTLPGAALVSETAEEASIVTSESLIHLGIQPNGVMVLDLELSHAPSQSRR